MATKNNSENVQEVSIDATPEESNEQMKTEIAELRAQIEKMMLLIPKQDELTTVEAKKEEKPKLTVTTFLEDGKKPDVKVV